MSDTRVRWTEDEEQQLADAFADAILRKPFGTFREWNDAAQATLPAGRRRIINAAAQIPSVTKLVHERINKFRTAAAAPPPPPKYVTLDPDPLAVGQDFVDKIPTEKLLQALMLRITGSLGTITAMLTAAAERPVHVTVQAPATEQPKPTPSYQKQPQPRPMVAVAAPVNTWPAIRQHATALNIDVHLIDGQKDGDRPGFPSKAVGAIVHYCSKHSLHQHAREAYGTERVHFVRGAASNILKHLEALTHANA